MLTHVTTHDRVLDDIRAYTDHEENLIAVLANVSAVLKQHRPQYAWVGFYLFGEDTQEMLLGPYQGSPTCTTRIPIGAGMCGLAARERKTIILDDVQTDPRYIACSPTVHSEIVVPLLDGERIFGVLDVDSDDLNTFGSEDQQLLETVARYVVAKYRRSKDASAAAADRVPGQTSAP
jgi:GAF domain-containing protein